MTGSIPVQADIAPEPGAASREPRSTGALVAVGALTIVFLTLAIGAWIDVHVEVWGAAARCSGSFRAPTWARGLASFLGGGSLAGLSISSLWLGVHPDDRWARRLFWAAIVLAWLAISAMALVAGHEIGECSVL